MCVCVCVCVCVYAFGCVRMHMRLSGKRPRLDSSTEFVCGCVSVDVDVYLCVYVCMCVRVCMCVCVWMCADAYAFIWQTATPGQ